MAINLMKRMESSVYSFNLTVKRIIQLIDQTLEVIDSYDKSKSVKVDAVELGSLDAYDPDDQNSEDFLTIGKKVKIEIADMDYVSWRRSLVKDRETLELLTLMVEDITPEHDCKLQELFGLVRQKLEQPINPGNKKILIFTAFADTADYLYQHVSAYVKKNFGLHTAMISGTVEGRTTVPRLHSDMNTVLTCFSPVSKDKELLMPETRPKLMC